MTGISIVIACLSALPDPDPMYQRRLDPD
jgi:hypothetical protein